MNFRLSESKSSSTRSYPHFTPHITLASGLPSSINIDNIRGCVSGRTAVHVAFKSISVGDTYFRSVYLNIHKSAELSALHQCINNELKKLNNVETLSPCFPHMSLYYIDDSEAGERQLVAGELLSSGRIVGDGGDKITCFTDTDPVGHHTLCGFDGDEIWIVNCKGLVDQWEILEKFVLLPS